MSTPKAAIIVIQEIFGVNPGIARNAISGLRQAIWPSRLTCSGGSHRDAAGAELADARTLAFFVEHLG